jgi:hypothetical protein
VGKTCLVLEETHMENQRFYWISHGKHGTTRRTHGWLCSWKIIYLVGGFNPSEKYERQLGL